MKNLQTADISEFIRPKELKKAKMVNKNWIGIETIYEKINPQAGLIEIFVKLVQKPAIQKITFQQISAEYIKEKCWHELSFKLTSPKNRKRADVYFHSVLKDNQWTALLKSAFLNEFDHLEVFFKYGVHAASNTLQSPLMTAAFKGYPQFAELLLSHKVNPNLKSQLGWTAAHFSARENTVDVMRILLKYNADIDISNNDLKTPLMIAVAHGSCNSVVFLLENGANYNLKDKFGHTTLEIARYEHNCDVCLYVLEEVQYNETSLMKLN